MPIYDIVSGAKLKDGEEQTYLYYHRSPGGVVDFKFGALELTDICYLKRILIEAEDEILAEFVGETEPEGKTG